MRFRDGANGLIVWAIGVVLTFFFVTAAVTKVGSAAGTAAANTAAAAVTRAAQPPSMDYFTDMLFRPRPQGGANGIAAGMSGNATPAAPANNANVERDQVNRIMLTSLSTDGMSNDDRACLAQFVSARTGLSQDDARHRVDDVVNRAKQDATQAVDTARKAAAYLSFWTFMSLLFGAAWATLAASSVVICGTWSPYDRRRALRRGKRIENYLKTLRCRSPHFGRRGTAA